MNRYAHTGSSEKLTPIERNLHICDDCEKDRKHMIQLLLRYAFAHECAYSARTAHPFRRNGAPFRFKLSKAQLVD